VLEAERFGDSVRDTACIEECREGVIGRNPDALGSCIGVELINLMLAAG
jgi:hypothetical protein